MGNIRRDSGSGGISAPVTLAQLAPLTAYTIMANITAAPAVPQAATIAEIKTMLSLEATLSGGGSIVTTAAQIYSFPTVGGTIAMLNAAQTFTAIQTIVIGTNSAWFTNIPGASGTCGLHISKSLGNVSPVGVIFEYNGTIKWELGLDFQNDDFVLAYNNTAPTGDQLRLSPDGNMAFGRTVGSPLGREARFTMFSDLGKPAWAIEASDANMTLAAYINVGGKIADAINIRRSDDTSRGWIQWSQGGGSADWRIGMRALPYDFVICNVAGGVSGPATPGTEYVTISQATGNMTVYGSGTFAGLSVTDAHDIVLGTTTGTKIGTLGGAAGQKMAFWNSTPIVQPVLATGAGHSSDDIITTLQNLGLVRQA